MAKVSIIVPVYKVENYIAKCLDSLVNQTLDDIEIIVVNDGSPDNEELIINKYLKKYPKLIKYYKKENGGLGSARNYGIEKATGEYIGYVDSDDYVTLDMFEKLYNKAKSDDLDLVLCDNYVVYDDSDKVVIERNDTRVLDNDVENAFFGKISVWNKLYRREIIGDFKFREKVWYEDVDFTLNCISKSKKIGYVHEPLYYYLSRKGSITTSSNIKRGLEILQAFDAIKDNKKYREIIEYLVINNIYISAVVRVIRADAKKSEKKDVIKVLIDYVNTNFKNFKKNKYIKTLPRNRKIIYHLINLRQFWLVKLIFKVK